MKNFNEQIILVTGAAGNLGSAVVEAYLNANGTVVALDHRTGRLSGRFDSIESAGKVHLFEGVDLTDRQAVSALAKRVRDEVGLVNVIVNIVGGFAAGDPVHELPLKMFYQMIELNVSTFLNTSAGFIPHLQEQGGGKVITIG